ncbi:MAG: helix-turn-helix domain-containing protein [Pseudomonadota bacterium]
MIAKAANLSMRSLPETEVQILRSELTGGEWTLRDARYYGFVLQAGVGRVRIDDNDLPVSAPCLIWFPAQAKAALYFEAGSRGMALAVSEIGFARVLSGSLNANQMRAALSRPLIRAKLDAAQARRIADTLDVLLDEALHDRPGAQETMRHYLALFLISAWRLSGPVVRETQPLPRTIVHKFLHAVEVHLRDHWTIARYAAEAGVTADRLNATVRRATGRSPLSIIHERLIAEADTLLDDSSLKIAEVAETLGFQDPAYFSRFYKRETGRSPNKQRLDVTARSDGQARSFAAWP